MQDVDIINSVLSMVEAGKIWGKNHTTLPQTIRRNSKFKQGVDWRVLSGNIVVTAQAMERVYGCPSNPTELTPGVSKKSFEDKLGMTRVGKQTLIPGDKGNGRNFTHKVDRVVYKHSSGCSVARILDVWFKVEGDRITDEYITNDDKLYKNGNPDPDNLKRLGFLL